MKNPRVFNTKIKIGIPRALMYFEHSRLWESFFMALGCQIILSPVTNKTILENGVKYCSNETCLPVKVFHGHVNYLMDKSDFIFIPRYISLFENAFCCPKLCGLPDMTLFNFKSSLDIIELNLDFHNGETKTLQSIQRISKNLDFDYEYIKSIYYEITSDYKHTKKELNINALINKNSCIGVLGHPYVIHDSYVSMDLIQKLNDKGYFVFTSFDIDKQKKLKNSDPFYNKVFWETGYDIMGSANLLINDCRVDKIIYLSAFGCGIDSVLTEFIQRQAKLANKNFLIITVDEHTGQAGFDTRLDAFLDMTAV